jgi:steroid 5-alpha reductase family enzyme
MKDFFSVISQTPIDSKLLTLVIVIAAIISLIGYIISLITGNCSQIDRLWSIIPLIYSIVFLCYPIIINKESLNLKLFLATLLITLWSIRLTFNYARKGGYLPGSEDYRWEYMRKHYLQNKCLFEIVNITFICIYQNYLILFFSMPGYYIYLNRHNSISWLEIAFVISFLGFLILESIADQQQWDYQSEKYRIINTNKSLISPYKEGFIQSGLFKYSRHPNYFGEVMLWWSFYFFSCAADCSLINFSVAGAILLSLLFLGSINLTEKISSQKYSTYVIYQKRVSMLVPWFSANNKIEEFEKNDLIQKA